MTGLVTQDSAEVDFACAAGVIGFFMELPF